MTPNFKKGRTQNTNVQNNNYANTVGRILNAWFNDCVLCQLPPWTEIMGDIRFTPFYDIDQCVEKMKGYIQELNNSKQFKFYTVCCILEPVSSN